MASTYSPSLRLELIGDGDQSGIWGQTTNNNLGALLEQAVSGVITITMSDANYTMSNFNGVVDEARNQVLIVTGTLTATRNLIAPLVEKTYVVQNNTTGSQSIQLIGSSGLGVTIPNGIAAYVYSDGINFYNAISGSVGNYRVNGNLTVTGTTALTGATTITGALGGSTATFSGAISSVSPTFTGTPTAITATAGTNTTQIATTAFVTGAITTATGALGTMSTQNANNVNITGGAISGLGTAIPVASGGTGRSTLTANNVVLGNGTSGVNFVAPGAAGNLLVSNATSWTSSTLAASGVKLGLGITGEVWNDVASGRGFNSTYTNSNAYPIAVSATATCAVTSEIHAYVDGVLIAWYQWQFNGCGSYGGTFIIVPPGKTYRLDSGQGVYQWKELY
jgi:hypothetical protein